MSAVAPFAFGLHFLTRRSFIFLLPQRFAGTLIDLYQTILGRNRSRYLLAIAIDARNRRPVDLALASRFHFRHMPGRMRPKHSINASARSGDFTPRLRASSLDSILTRPCGVYT